MHRTTGPTYRSAQDCQLVHAKKITREIDVSNKNWVRCWGDSRLKRKELVKIWSWKAKARLREVETRHSSHADKTDAIIDEGDKNHFYTFRRYIVNRSVDGKIVYSCAYFGTLLVGRLFTEVFVRRIVSNLKFWNQQSVYYSILRSRQWNNDGIVQPMNNKATFLYVLCSFCIDNDKDLCVYRSSITIEKRIFKISTIYRRDTYIIRYTTKWEQAVPTVSQI